MASFSSPFVRVLVTFLTKDKLHIATNMVRTWMNCKMPHAEESQTHQSCTKPFCCSDCCISRLTSLNNSTLPCYEFHWSCVLQQLTANRITIDEKENKLNYLPLLLTLPVVTQQNFVLLINEFQHSIPKHRLTSFVSIIRSNMNPDLESSSWLGYLLTSLVTTIDTESKAATCVSFSNSFINRISNTFGLSDSYNVVAYHNNPVEDETESLPEGANPCITAINDSSAVEGMLTLSSRKRSLDDDDGEGSSGGFNRFKMRRTDSTSDYDDELNDLDEVDEVQQRTELVEATVDSSTQECIEQAVDNDNDTISTTKGTEIVNNWKDGVLCPQSDFDEFISSNELLTSFIQQAVIPTYSESGIESMATNLMNSKLTISHFNLLNYFKNLLVEKIVQLQAKIPRSLISLITSLFEKHPFSFVEGFLLTFICHERFASNHCVVACKMIKDTLTDNQRIRLWTDIMGITANSRLKWSDQLSSCLTVLIDRGGAAFQVEHNDFICSLEINAPHHNKNVPFAKFLLSLVTKCNKSKLLEVKSTLLKIVTDNGTPLKSKLLKHLKDIEL